MVRANGEKRAVTPWGRDGIEVRVLAHWLCARGGIPRVMHCYYPNRCIGMLAGSLVLFASNSWGYMDEDSSGFIRVVDRNVHHLSASLRCQSFGPARWDRNVTDPGRFAGSTATINPPGRCGTPNKSTDCRMIVRHPISDLLAGQRETSAAARGGIRLHRHWKSSFRSTPH